MKTRIWVFGVLVGLVVALSACSSLNTLLVAPPGVAPEYRDAELTGGRLAVVLQQDSLAIGGDASEGLEVSGVRNFESFFMQSLADSIRTRGGFSSVEIHPFDETFPTTQQSLFVNSTRAEVFVTPGGEEPIELGGGVPDYILLITFLDVRAEGPRLNGSGLDGMGMGPPTLHGGARFVTWDNIEGKTVTWGDFDHYVDPKIRFEHPVAWHRLAEHMAGLMFRNTPFKRG